MSSHAGRLKALKGTYLRDQSAERSAAQRMVPLSKLSWSDSFHRRVSKHDEVLLLFWEVLESILETSASNTTASLDYYAGGWWEQRTSQKRSQSVVKFKVSINRF